MESKIEWGWRCLIGAFCNGKKIKNCSTFSIATSGRRITGSEREKTKSSSSSTPLATGEEIRRLNEKIGVLTSELKKTKADNVKLYGKIRYVQDHNSERVISRGSKKYAEDLGSGFSSDEESNYKKMYEEDINPFAAFSKKERHQRYKELGLRDKITLRSGCFLLGNK